MTGTHAPDQQNRKTDIETGFERHLPATAEIRRPGPDFLQQRQHAEVSLTVTKEAGFKAKAEITNGGLLSIAALVSSILLSTAVLVHVAVVDGKRPRRPW